MLPQVTITDLLRARERISRFVRRTALYENLTFSEKTGADVWLKFECHQPTGVFKVRGAFNIILENIDSLKEHGVITASSGNHGLSVAFVARKLSVNATVVVTDNANPDKLKLIKQYGARVVPGGLTTDAIISNARKLASEEGMFFIHPFDDPSVIAGQGTVGLEIFEDLPDVDTIIVPVGGGGLISGISIAARALSDHCSVIGVEATGVPSLYETLKKGELVTIREPRTIADGLIGQTVGRLNFDICRRNVKEVLLVTDEQMKEATKYFISSTHTLAEPSGTASLAALLEKYRAKPKEKIALVISGGNIAYKQLQELLKE